jgi:hypothetical protein
LWFYLLLKAGIFRGANVCNGEAAASMEVEEGEEGSGGGRREETVEISSENSGPMRSKSDDDFEGEGEHDHEDDDDGDDKNKKKKRKKYHRHTAEQIREMEAYVFLSHPLSLAVVLYFVRTVTVCSRRLRERKQDCKAKKTTQKSLFSLFNSAQHTD